MEEFWSYHPGIFSDIKLEEVLKECGKLLSSQRVYKGQEKIVSRFSCVFATSKREARKKLPSYDDMQFYRWHASPTTLAIKNRLEEIVGHSFDYVLLHHYVDGTASIGYHNDNESLDGEVASVSIGQKRKFRIRNFDETSGYIKEFLLGGGDLLIMKKGMQRKYKHGIPKELKIKSGRLNWTFRSYQE